MGGVVESIQAFNALLTNIDSCSESIDWVSVMAAGGMRRLAGPLCRKEGKH